MKKNGFGILSIAWLVCLFSLSALPSEAASQTQRNFLWKVQSETNTVYLLGSVHFMKKDIYPLNDEIEEAFRLSDVLAVEANINDVTRIDLQKMLGSAFYPEGDSLEKHISAETFERAKKEFDESGLPSLLITRQKPWFLALTLESLKLMQAGFDPTYGIDVHFLSKAQGQKKIRELESIDYQIDLLSGFSDSEQEEFLRYTLNDLNSLEKNIDILITAWKTGDAMAMESVIGQGVKDDRSSGFNVRKAHL